MLSPAPGQWQHQGHSPGCSKHPCTTFGIFIPYWRIFKHTWDLQHWSSQLWQSIGDINSSGIFQQWGNPCAQLLPLHCSSSEAGISALKCWWWNSQVKQPLLTWEHRQRLHSLGAHKNPKLHSHGEKVSLIRNRTIKSVLLFFNKSCTFFSTNFTINTYVSFAQRDSVHLLGTAVSNSPRNLLFFVLRLSTCTNPVFTSCISLFSAFSFKDSRNWRLLAPRKRVSPFNIIFHRSMNKETHAIISAPNPHFYSRCSSYTGKKT